MRRAAAVDRNQPEIVQTVRKVFHLALPKPISANHLFVNAPGKGRRVSQDYKAWKKIAGGMLASQATPVAPLSRCQITYYIGERGVGQMDAGNAEKAYTDALVNAGVLVDDKRKHLRAVRMIWVPDMGGCVACIQEADIEPRAGTILSQLSGPSIGVNAQINGVIS